MASQSITIAEHTDPKKVNNALKKGDLHRESTHSPSQWPPHRPRMGPSSSCIPSSCSTRCATSCRVRSSRSSSTSCSTARARAPPRPRSRLSRTSHGWWCHWCHWCNWCNWVEAEGRGTVRGAGAGGESGSERMYHCVCGVVYLPLSRGLSVLCVPLSSLTPLLSISLSLSLSPSLSLQLSPAGTPASSRSSA